MGHGVCADGFVNSLYVYSAWRLAYVSDLVV